MSTGRKNGGNVKSTLSHYSYSGHRYYYYHYSLHEKISIGHTKHYGLLGVV